MRQRPGLLRTQGQQSLTFSRERLPSIGCYIFANPSKLNDMFEDLKDKAAGLVNNENVKEVVDKATEFINTEKGKEVVETVKEKATEFIKDKFGK